MPGELKKILYVEDDVSISELTILSLEEFGGYTVQHCASGAAALEAYAAFEPDLFLLDVMIPGMDGPETLRQLQKMSGGRDIPAVFMTAKAQTHEQDAYKAMGAVDVIVKPFDAVKLPDRLEDIWNAATTSQAAQAAS